MRVELFLELLLFYPPGDGIHIGLACGQHIPGLCQVTYHTLSLLVEHKLMLTGCDVFLQIIDQLVAFVYIHLRAALGALTGIYSNEIFFCIEIYFELAQDGVQLLVFFSAAPL